MTINERVRYFRKEVLKMNQSQFAKCLGMKQTGVSSFERGTIKDSTIKTLCLAFNLNENWIRNGVEPMYLEEQLFDLQDFIEQNHISNQELNFLVSYFKLDPNLRKQIFNFFKICFDHSSCNDIDL